MKNKIFLAIVLAVFATGGTGYYFYRNYNQPKTEAVLDAPRECVIGELVIFDASENQIDDIVWKIYPPTPNFKIIDDGKKAIFSSGRPGNYTITVAIANNGEVKLIITELFVIPGSTQPEFDQLINLLPDEVRNLIPDEIIDNLNPNEIRTLIDNPNRLRNLLPNGISLFDTNLNQVKVEVDIDSWLPSEPKSSQIDRAIKGLTTLTNLIDKNRFETKDEIVQAVIWSIRRSTYENDDWKPFRVNLLKYLEDATSKQDCIQRVNAVLTSLKEINEKT